MTKLMGCIVLCFALTPVFSADETSETNTVSMRVGVKGGYGTPMDDYDIYNNSAVAGVYYNLRASGYCGGSMGFQVTFDVFTLAKSGNDTLLVPGINLDFYGFLGNYFISPFYGFGFAANYLPPELSDQDETEEQNATTPGFNAFVGTDITIPGTDVTLSLEARYKLIQITNWSSSLVQYTAGVAYAFDTAGIVPERKNTAIE